MRRTRYSSGPAAHLSLSRFTVLGVIVGALAVALITGLLSYRSASAQATPPPPDPGLGAQLYAQNCAACHGDQGQGRIGATLDKDWPSIRPDLTVREIIRSGVSGSPMPAWSLAKGGPLADAEIDAIVTYILSWQTGGGPVFTPRPTVTRTAPITPIPELQGDPNNGAALFSQNCAMCHGPDGQGRVGATLAKDFPGIRPDLMVRETIANGVSGSPMPAWSQSRGGPLTETEIDDLAAFVLTLGQTHPVVQVSPDLSLPGAVQSPLTGWAGVVVFAVLLAAIVIAALRLQQKKS